MRWRIEQLEMGDLALNLEFDRIDANNAKSQREGNYPVSRNCLIEKLKTNPELRAAIKEVLTDEATL